MPSSSHPQAQFVPIQPDLDLTALVENTNNFDFVTRLPFEMIKEHSIQHLEQLIQLHVVIGGKPLVIENWDELLDPYLFSSQWLQDHVGKKAENVRDIPNASDIPMTIGHYMRSMPQLGNQFTPTNYRDPKRQRLYLKDIDCPEEWAKSLQEILPETFFYLNECIESRTGGDGAILEPNEYGQMKYGKGIAPAGDLMSSLPPEMRAMNMMCYIGHEGTYTPAHREMCASLGHNVMVEASESGNGEREGSSIWFMTETKEREVVSEYFLSMLGHDIEVEKHFAQVNAWKKAPFNVWVVEQRPGDLILIPPLAPHQVWNRGTRTMKAAWNRTTVDTLELALHEALPRARLVCREEQYKNKAIIYYTLIKYHKMLQRDTIDAKMWKYGRIKQVLEDFKRLFALYTEILVSEMFASILPSEQSVEFVPYDSNVTCSYCRCNIFNRFLTCKTCIETGPNGEEDTYDICMECYAMGRSCGCMSNLKWVEQWEWSVLAGNYEEWRNLIVQCDGFFDVQKSPQPLDVARKRYGRKPVAHICQEQLKLRPWHDISKPFVPDPSPGMSDEEPEVDDSGRPKKRIPQKARNGRVPRVKNKTQACHVCCHHDWNWRLAFCSTCSNAYCYGVLWRAFDLMPQTVMEDRDWSCPKCQGICSCGKCRKNPKQSPYAPKGTLLGHDTKKVADVRSVESLVDFSRTNLGWLRGENDHNPHESERMKRLKEKAEQAKAREDVIDENYVDKNADLMTGEDSLFVDDGQIDPLLRTDTMLAATEGPGEVHYKSPYEPTALGTDYPNNLEHGDPEAMLWRAFSDSQFNDEFNISRRLETSYPSALLGPVTAPPAGPTPPVAAPVAAPEKALEKAPEKAPAGQNRMMGFGFYEQDNGVDKILYDPPDEEGTASESLVIPTSTAENLALSDILQQPPNLQAPKKRRRGFGSGDEDTEFFASKRQKKLAGAKKSNVLHGEASKTPPRSSPPQRPSRVSVGKPQTYLDLGEDAMPVSDSEIVIVKTRNSKSTLSVNGTKQATRASRHKRSSEPSARRSTRGKAPLIVAPPEKPTPPIRKSAWLARKEQQEAGMSSPALPGRRGRPRGRRVIPPPSEEASSDNSENEDSSRFGGPDREKAESTRNSKKSLPQKEEPTSRGRGRRASRREPAPEEDQIEKPAPRPRGRPRKSAAAPTKPSGLPQLLSLKEKMALQGKSAKIVSRTRPSRGRPAAAAKGPSPPNPSAAPQIQTGPVAIASSGMHVSDQRLRSPSEDATTPPTSNLNSQPNGSANVKVEAVRKGPTVVRLSSPSPNYDSDSSSGDDSSIPAAKALRR